MPTVLVVQVDLGGHPGPAGEHEADAQPALHEGLAARLQVAHRVARAADPAQPTGAVDRLLEAIEGRRAGPESGVSTGHPFDHA
ncbi:MAG: hypothetical protein WCD35_02605, partial [Mycobacteriales bacterium]